MPSSLEILPMAASDLVEVRELTEQLGYPSSLEETRARFERIHSKVGEHALWVARLDGRTVGWLHLLTKTTLGSEPCAEVGGLVVDERHRGNGIGARLMSVAEGWAKERGFRRLELRSRMDRERAHQFYIGLGYNRTKISAVFSKVLGD